MLNTLLVPVDNSSLVKGMIKKLPSTLDLTNKTIYLIHVSDPYYENIYSESALSEYYISEKAHKEMCENLSNAFFEKYKKALGTAGKVQTIHVYSSNVPDSILSAAKKYKVDGIIMASHRYKGVDNVLLGNKAHKVIVSSKLPILIL
jgi:nucleotide-binding universal stress UspA family protein